MARAQRPRIIAVGGPAQARTVQGLVLVVFLLLTQPVGAQQEQQELEAVRQRIEAVERRMAGQQAEMDSGVQALRSIETQIAARHEELARIRADRERQSARLAELEARARRAGQALQAESGALARQVRLSYMTGREELLKLLLNQEDPAMLGRMVTYYDYFNRLRGDRIRDVRGQLRELDLLRRETAEAEAALAELAAAQQRGLEALERARAERREVVAELEADLSSAGRELESLRADEERLTDLVIELGDLLAAFPVGAEEPFASLRGRLPWPAQGSITGDYGQPRNGGPLRWNGVLLDAEPGAAVRAVYRGRVAFSDWLPGLGLLLIVDHGDDYLSLYGHNEVLLKEPGEWVEPGEVLARVGDSGGRAGAGLYFELRHKGEPVDPHQWMRDAPEAP